MKHELKEYAAVFKALGDETRLRILLMLTKGKTCACYILDEFHFTQPTLSYHMKQLTESGLVNAEKKSKWVYYSTNKECVELLKNLISEINETAESSDCCGIADESTPNCC